MKKRNLRKKLAAVVLGIGIIAGGLWKEPMKVYAVEEPEVTELNVAATDDGTGVIAKCNYRNYNEQSGCEITLYLYRVESSSHSVIASHVLAYADEGSASTDSAQVSEGIYMASVAMNYGMDMKQVNSKNYFKVTQEGGGYQVTEEGSRRASISLDGEWISEAGMPCEHDGEYVLERQATPVEDAVQMLQCVRCGAVLERTIVPNSAYAAFLKETEEMIQNAQPGEIVIDAGQWISFNREVLETISSRTDVTLKVHYIYCGEAYEMVIPSGMDVTAFADENGFCGFQHMEEMISIMKNL